VLFHAGRPVSYHADDEAPPFHPTPHFVRWVPLAGPEHVVVARPGERPRVFEVRPPDFWLESEPAPPSYWQGEVELVPVESFAEALEAAGPVDRLVYVGNSAPAAAEAGFPAERVEPAALLAPLDWFRAYKTEHEVALMRIACQRAADGHQGALEVFDSGASEREVHWAYLESTGHTEAELPFATITAFDDKASILHYQAKRGPEAAPGNVLLLDAGATCDGYAADVTRTWARPEVEPHFLELLAGVDALERELVAMVRPGTPYLDIHVATHQKLAALLAAVGIVKSSPEEALAAGVTAAFMPHGVGHHLGIQVHDVGGHQAGPEGGEVAPPDEHAFLRNTRVLEPGHVVTIEPGLYFIPLLLEPLRSGETAALLDWTLVDRLTPYGGIRIEDDVLCTEGDPEDLTRPLLDGTR
jgi:Xaa-Pro dipeptidase